MKPTYEQIKNLRREVNVLLGSEITRMNHALAEAIIARWESIRPADNEQLVRTNQELGTYVINLKAELVQAKRDIAELNERLHERTQAFLSKAGAPAPVTAANKPLEFGDPPAGYTWHNPENLTPEQVEVDKGWRLCLKEETPTIPHQFFTRSGWMMAVGADDAFKVFSYTYRTKAPLPAPKPTPTPESLKRAEIQAWAVKGGWRNFTTSDNGAYQDASVYHMWNAWQASAK